MTQPQTSYSPTWHTAVLWFLGAMALIALASPAPGIATLIVLILIAGLLLAHWSDTYAPFLGLK
jgi:hypothetical protein